MKKKWPSPEQHVRARPSSFANGAASGSDAAAALQGVRMGGAMLLEGTDLDNLNSRPRSYCHANHSPTRVKRLQKKIKEKEKEMRKLEGKARKLSKKRKAKREILLQRKLRDVSER